jgi:hypothetical protein
MHRCKFDEARSELSVCPLADICCHSPYDLDARSNGPSFACPRVLRTPDSLWSERRHVVGPGAPPGRHVTIAWEKRKDRPDPRLLISIGRALDAELGTPETYIVQVFRGRIMLTPVAVGGNRVNRSGVPRFHDDGQRNEMVALLAGAYEARVVAGRLIVGVDNAPRR